MSPWSASDTSTASSRRRCCGVGSRRVTSRYDELGEREPAHDLARAGRGPATVIRRASRRRSTSAPNRDLSSIAISAGDCPRGASKSTSAARAVSRELVLRQPVGRRVRQLGDDLDVARHLERGELLARERVQRGEVGRTPGRGDDERLHVFLRQVRRHADHGRLGDVGMAFERGLDLGGRQVLAAAADDFLLATEERVGLVGVDAHEVAGAQPAVDDHRRGLLRHLVVAAHDHRVAQLELARLARRRRPDRRRSRARRSRDPSTGCWRAEPSEP